VRRARITGLSPGRPSPSVLVVDDEADQRELLRELLTELGLATFEAADAEAALRSIAERRPDLVFMDVRLPGMDGVEATRRIRATPSGKDLPIVIASASVLADEQGSALSTGANEFIHKPFREDEIWGALERHLGPIFEYAAPGDEARAPAPVERAEVLALGPSVLEQLRDAVELGYVGRVPAILAHVTTERRPTAQALERLAAAMELETLRRLIA